MALTAGGRLGPYEILAVLGSGGMGEVYRAHDTKLGRDVALKLLPTAFANDSDRLARFEREAHVLASLNHSHIAAIYGLEESDGLKALVLELVDGQTLADRIAQGMIPIDEALPIAKQIAEALEAAHEQGIIHRDLKPANIKLRPDGTVKVLDFGLAKALEPVGAMGSPASLANSPTITSPAVMTGAGMILGTAAYMAPEQAKGKPADKRSDIWAFGCVFYEMLAGRRAFAAEDVSDTLAAILRGDPDWSALPSATPASIRTHIRRCVTKDGKQRLQAIGEARIAIEQALTGGSTPTEDRSARPIGARPWFAWIAAAIALLVAAAVGLIHFREQPPTPPELMRFEITLTGVESGPSVALSPDGRYLAYATAGDDGRNVMWVRALSSLQARRLAGTEGVIGGTFWSPDSRFLAFRADGKLKKIDVSGGPPQTIGEVPSSSGGTWNEAGVILIGGGGATGLVRVSAADGVVSSLTKVDLARELDHFRPDFLPDGRHFVYLRTSNKDVQNSGVFVGSLDTGPDAQPSKPLLTAQGGEGAGVKYVPASSGPGPGFLLFLRDETLMAQRFDPTRLELAGEAVPISDTTGAELYFSASQNGIIVHRPVSSLASQMTWLDRAGRVLGPLGNPTRQQEFNLSPDGNRVAAMRAVARNSDIWVVDVDRGSSQRLTLDPAMDLQPVWSPDGSEVVFTSRRNGRWDLFTKAANGAGEERMLLESFAYAQDWSNDGRYLLYVITPASGVKTAPDLWVLPMDRDRKPIPYLATASAERQSKFSPDGRWVAYTSDESGKPEIHVRPFPDSSKGNVIVSVGGGTQPRWRRDGKELFYIAPDDKLMVVDIVTMTRDGIPAIKAGSPRPLFTAPKLPIGGVTTWGEAWDVAPDGLRFLFNTTIQETERPPVTVVLNWQSGLKK